MGSKAVDILTYGVRKTKVSQSKVFYRMWVFYFFVNFSRGRDGRSGLRNFQKSFGKDVNILEEACLLFEIGSSFFWPFRCFVLCMRHIVNSR